MGSLQAMLPSSRMVFILSIIGVAAFCQTPRVEIGVQLSGLRENVLGEYPLGGGGRITVHAFRFVDVEAEVNRYPIGGGDSVFPATQITFGARAGQRFGPLGIYGKVKPGFVRFDQDLYVPNMGTHAALDMGAVLEFYARHHFAGRLDLGDTVVFYGNGISIPSIATPGPGIVPGTRHQLQWSLGFLSGSESLEPRRGALWHGLKVEISGSDFGTSYFPKDSR